MKKKDYEFRQGHTKEQKRHSNKMAGYAGLGLILTIIYLVIDANFLK